MHTSSGDSSGLGCNTWLPGPLLVQGGSVVGGACLRWRRDPHIWCDFDTDPGRSALTCFPRPLHEPEAPGPLCWFLSVSASRVGPAARNPDGCPREEKALFTDGRDPRAPSPRAALHPHRLIPFTTALEREQLASEIQATSRQPRVRLLGAGGSLFTEKGYVFVFFFVIKPKVHFTLSLKETRG